MGQHGSSLDGQVAIVTGAGRGIGAATAVALARAGADVAVVARSEDSLKKVAEEIAATGRRAYAIAADLDDLEFVAGLPTTVADELGRLDVIVNNVGSATIKPFLETDWTDLEEAMRLNVATAHTLTRAAVPHLLGPGRSGAVVNICSTVGRVGARGFLSYGMAKAALAQYTRLAARDLAPRIRVNGVVPGSIATDNLRFVMQDDALRGRLEQATPMRRAGRPEDVADAVVYLASPASSYVTGKLLEVDGGIDTPNIDLGIPDLGTVSA
ncbi:SDR family oxidoreductase [Streptomyces sp. NPDC001668]|uniref:SDR family oxidoreductase n=1 Tax=unclassified Streptomyces TaxID=2593676 RepID=UPI00368EC4FD